MNEEEKVDTSGTGETLRSSAPHPILSTFPAYLKDPKNYNKIQRTVLESLASKHSHGEIVEWAACAGCQRRFAERGELLKKLGFASPAHYMIWNQIHRTIKERVPFAKYDD